MNYSRDLKNLSNVTISDGSPRSSGEQASRSEWQEMNLPFGYQERVTLVKELAGKYAKVHLKSATGYKRARLFVKA